MTSSFPTSLTDIQKKRGLIILLANAFLMWGGFFMVVPLLAVHYVDGLGWAAASIGIVLALRQLTQQGLAFLGGMLADRVGAKGLICAGLLVRFAGFSAMAWAASFPILLLTAILAALGGALFEAPKSASLAALTDENNRSRYYSLQGVVGGLGVTLGSLTGSLLLKTDFSTVALVAGSCYLLAFLLTLLFLPAVRTASESPGSRALGYGMRLALGDKPFMTFNVLLMGYWFMWVQLSISLPLKAVALSGTSDAVSWLYAINAGMSIVLQYPLLRLMERWLKPLGILKVGITLMALGLGCVAFVSSVSLLLGCVALFSLGALLVSPSQQTVTAGLASPAALGSYFGVAGFALAIGGGLGNYAGGWLYGLSTQLGSPALPWLVFAAAGISAVVGLNLLFQEPAAGPHKEPVSAAKAQPVKG
jgi:DHA1 family multidrug resistance protein-like MFS transporter